MTTEWYLEKADGILDSLFFESREFRQAFDKNFAEQKYFITYGVHHLPEKPTHLQAKCYYESLKQAYDDVEEY